MFGFIGDVLGSVVDTAIDGVIAVADFAEDNPAVAKVATVATVAATGGVAATFFAPQIATALGSAGFLGTTATTGKTISTLSGIALEKASLAAVGGGALSVGGTGIAGGTAVIGAVGTGAGAAVGGTVTATMKS